MFADKKMIIGKWASKSTPKKKSESSITLILWDLGNVLISLNYPLFFETLSSLFRQPLSTMERWLFSHEAFELFNKGEISSEEFFLRLCRSNRCDVAFSSFEEAWSTLLEPRPEMALLLEELAPHVEMALLSNTDPIHHRRAQRIFPELGLLKPQLTSYELGSMKPEPKIYELALNILQKDPQEILFFDDKSENVIAARQLGIQAFLWENYEGGRKILSEFGLLSYISLKEIPISGRMLRRG